ncbi:MAG: HEAT repeat domain-containing protein [bacterium]
MKKQQVEAMIVEYLRGDLTPRQEEEFKELLRQNGYELSELEELEAVFSSMESFRVPEPSEKMDIEFYSMLDACKKKLQKRRRRIRNPLGLFQSFFAQRHVPQFAYGVILLVAGWAVGAWLTPGVRSDSQLHRMSAEIQEMREVMMLTLIDQSSVTQRLKAVNLTMDLKNVNDKVIQALLKTLNNDPNENVRLATVEALREFADYPKVREGLIQSIGRQESALVQLALADVMIALQEKRSVEQFQELLKRRDLNDTIRGRIERTVAVLM